MKNRRISTGPLNFFPHNWGYSIYMELRISGHLINSYHKWPTREGF